jgi:Na+-translocating ferredoxin:NAD+ oxidoreductase RnfC subunit
MTINEVRNNGVVGAGGAGFPTAVKLDSRPDTLIMNAAECEPLLHKDMEILRHQGDAVLDGFQAAMRLTGAKHGIIGIKEKNSDVIQLLKKKLDSTIQLHLMGDFYPAGDEITLIYEVTGRTVQPGQLPITVGCVVQNVETLFNIGLNKPVADKFISVAGAVDSPATVKVPVGISYREILSQFKIVTKSYVIRSGGLMMGAIERDLDTVVTKTTGALIVLPSDHHCVTMYDRFATEHDTDRIAKASCDQCNYCTEFCPRYLLGHPVRPETAMRNRMFSREGEPFVDLGSAFCCECNLCTLYACPESLDPKGATVIEKRLLREQDLHWEGLPVKSHPMMEYRKVPTKKLMQRLDVIQYKDAGPMQTINYLPLTVRLPLDQHIGAKAKPRVKVNEEVKKYDMIAEADGRISSNIHASIDGKVSRVDEHEIEIKRA